MRFTSKRKLGARALSLLVIFALLFGTVSSALAFTKNETVAATGLINIRSGPGTNYSVTGKLSKGEQAKFLSSSGSWSKIEVNGKVAYAFSKYLKSVGSSPNTGSDKLYATTGVNVRSGPGTNYTKVGTLAKDQQVTKVGSSGKWMQIVFGTGYAYVHGQYLTATEPDNIDDTTNAPNTPNTPNTPSTGIIVTQTYAYTYADYNRGYYANPLAVGTTVTTTGVVTNGFYQIIYGTGYAYVPQGSISVGTVNPGGPTGGTYQRYTSKITYVYDTVDSTGTNPGSVQMTLAANTLVTCVSTIGKYTKIIFGFTNGYVLTTDLTGGTPGGTTMPGYGNNTIKTDTVVYAEPRSASNILGFVYRGQAVFCTGVVIGEFAQVIVASGTYGYVATNCLTNPVSSTGGGGAINPVTRTLLYGSSLYSQPYGTADHLKGYANKNVTVTVIAVVGTWSQITFNGFTYYTLSSNLTL